MMNKLTSYFPPAELRMHEAFGPGADFFAFALAGRLGGAVLWVRECWQAAAINPIGFARFIAPERLLLVQAEDQKQLLAVAEEALRSGAIRLVVMEISQPMDLTAGRRLQLAARDGRATGLAIIPEGMGSNAAETRWHCAPLFDAETTGADSTLQVWRLIKNKKGTLGAWHVRWDDATHRVIMVSPVGE